jgi:tetratricopeptide (TPR) repeat protein
MLTSDFKTALAHLEAGRASDALPILSRIVEKWPFYAAAHIAHARALQASGDPEASFGAWTQAEALVSHSEVVRSGLISAAADLFGDGPAPVHADAPASGEPETVEVEPSTEAPFAESVGSRDQGLRREQGEPSGASVEAAPTEPAEAEQAETESAEKPIENHAPEFVEGSAVDPALFVPIAGPVDEPSIPDTAEAEWTEDVIQDDGPAETTEQPQWEGEYTGDAVDGAGTDFDLESDQTSGDVEFDRLIDDLESARIVPADDPSSVPAPDLSDDIDDVVSETLARIYVSQKQFSEAARVHDRLAKQNPERADEFESKASEMRGRSQ